MKTTKDVSRHSQRPPKAETNWAQGVGHNVGGGSSPSVLGLNKVLSFLEKSPPTCPPFHYFKTDMLISVFRDETNRFPKCRRMV
ncbi:hypothetical protein TNCV_2617561 [Trichonephila clavipes]|nr:hypothetical protein TNCV_2617561 [Trichonephila clavipes]